MSRPVEIRASADRVDGDPEKWKRWAWKLLPLTRSRAVLKGLGFSCERMSTEEVKRDEL